ncbi:MAG: NifU family protein [Zymomonas mobilis]|uniref:Scaffold protein Nfu/NifU n=1 Tax=Zymomonas mobilis subsp. mobilis (strain ATCC 10988 / DSM 424 / LMG 404 / NCIMB 8938 / NRRL B-806 / ZM1) TaxID=555217 RepID=A0A0H3G4E5_ZYMMA|nr:NifU family protein [Zymomonas mobilis]ACV76305.1 Scaffold protein Nfu/NifU [Zymomonas mobilis subsp. mobilis NCIMB 11163]AEH63505.1 Scaffold protein Nfu/NifU [Zymomonas mobilis subsp. mobilis ATCC 10988]TQL26881.1 Fe-S cluster biogenesis protein NfuA [Zymomonas mobilis]TQL30527.1 Fe-S cluster biogenesis protein NfuA [Zymomonas mobilis]
MLIETEKTPNPATLKFLLHRPVMERESRYFVNKEEAADSPLAVALFDLQHVTAVFYGRDFISVTLDSPSLWSNLESKIIMIISDHFDNDIPLLVENSEKNETKDHDEEDDVILQIKDLIDSRVRPAVARDGGDIVFQKFEDGIVYLSMRGACAGCPSSVATLKQGVETLLKHFVPEIKEVRAI